MNAIVDRVTALINEQNARLEASMAAEMTGGAAGSPPTEAGVTPGNATAAENADEAAANNALRTELTHWSSRVKMLIPIFVLLLFKLLADNFVTGFVVILCTTSFYRLKAAFELELALKDRSNRFSLLGLLLGSVGLLWAVVSEISLLSYHDSIGNRLIFHFPDSKLKTDPSFGNTLWSCIVTDGVAQLAVLVVKILVVNAIGLYSHVQRSGFKCPTSRSLWHNGVQFSSLSPHDDLETGGSTSQASHGTAASAFAATISSLGLNSIGSSISSLVRRQTTPTAHSRAQHQLQRDPRHHHPHSDHDALTATALTSSSDAVGDGQTSSDGSVAGRESLDFLVKVRACGIVDMLGLVYRSALPLPYWALYFYLCPTIGMVLRITYVAVKLYDLSWKTKGAAEATMLFVTNKIEFGHYSTEEDLRGREDGGCECPVCFDNPHRPVTLDCHHTFCEVCILEWLEKEQTCPVCRAKVEGSSQLVQAVKAESVYSFPIFV